MTDPSISSDSSDPTTTRPAPSVRARELRVKVLAFAVVLLMADLGVVVTHPAPAIDNAKTLAAFDAGGADKGPAPLDPGAPADVDAALPAPAAQAPAPEPPPPPALAPGEVERIPLVGTEPRLATFAGLSTWVDLYDVEISPESQAHRAAAGGAQTIFVQSARFNSPTDIHDPARLGRLIETAHDLGMRVMTWYLPDHVDHARDLRRSQAAIHFTTPRGDRPDAFGLDIENEDMPDIAERNRRLLQLSAQLRDEVGPDYPLAAIVLPPLQLDMRPGWWPNFPWAELRPFYDVFVPMSYSSFRGSDAGTTYRWNFDNVVKTRQLTGDPNLPIHMAGGIADRLPHVDAFVDALRDGKVLGGGLYDLHTTHPGAWARLRALRVE